MARITTAIFVLGAIGSLIGGVVALLLYVETEQGKWVMKYVSTDSLTLYLFLIVLALPWLAIWKAWMVGRAADGRLIAMDKGLGDLAQRLDDLEKWRIAEQPRQSIRAIADNEVDDVANTRWSWNGNEAQGPFCPRHGERLKLSRHSGSAIQDFYSNFEEQYLGASGWFACPTDQKEEFRVLEHVKVKTLRWRIGERFRAKYGLLPAEEPLTEQEREMRRVARENAARLFPPPTGPAGAS